MTTRVDEVSGVTIPRLTANDRCDRCGAQAYVITDHLAGELKWCAHHARVHRDALANHVVVDETSTLTTPATMASPDHP